MEDETKGGAPEKTAADTAGSEPQKLSELPTPENLAPEAPKPADLPSKISLSDIPLPSYMKGGPPRAPAEARAAGSMPFPAGRESALERSMREIGIKAPLKGEKRIVAIAKDQRTEIDEDGLPRLRTYAKDVSEEIRKRGATMATIVGAERERIAKEDTPPPPEKKKISPRTIAFLAGAGALVLIGAAAIAAAIIFSPKGPSVQTPAPGLIYANKTVRLEVAEDPLPAALTAERETAALSLGEVERIIPTVGGVEASAPSILAALGAPETLARNAKRVMLGVHAFDRNQPFIIVETNFYDITFEGMLEWEPRMAETLGGFFRPVSAVGRVPELHFTDAIFKNIDMRQSERTWPVIYAFPERDLLIVTTNENTLAEILTRRSVSVR